MQERKRGLENIQKKKVSVNQKLNNAEYVQYYGIFNIQWIALKC